MADTPDWYKQAACRGLEVGLFFADKGDAQTARTAMAYCNGGVFDVLDDRGRPIGKDETPACPVRVACLEFALSFPPDQDAYGIYGGMTPHQRDKIRTARRMTGGARTVRVGVSLRGREPKPTITS